jgi:hypothetical protein
VLSVESIMRRAAMLVFLPVAGGFGAESAIYLCGAVGFGGGLVLAMTARRRDVQATAERPAAPGAATLD